MGHHEPGVDTGIGSACSGDRSLVAQQGCQRFFELGLYGDAVGLYLPAVVSGAIEREVDEIAWHKIGNRGRIVGREV